MSPNNNPNPPTGPNPEEPSETPPEVESLIANYEPRLEPAEADVAPEVLPEVRQWVAAATPKRVEYARCMMRAATCYAIWGLLTLGTFDKKVLLIPHNTEHWLHHVSAHKPDSWRRNTRSRLRSVCRAANPHAWAAETTALARAEVAVPYNAAEEMAFSRSVRMPGRTNRAARLWAGCASLGCGLYAAEAALVRPEHITEASDGRLQVHVGERNPRIVPIRHEWTAIGREALDAATDNRFVRGQDPTSSLRQVAVRIFDNPAVNPHAPSLSWYRARNTWLLAHLRAGTPVHVLHRLAGSLSLGHLHALGRYLGEIEDQTAADMGMAA